MKIATWNISEGYTRDKDGRSSENLSYYSEELRKLNPDIICLQESLYISDKKSQAREIANYLGFGNLEIMLLDKSHLTEGGWNSLAILSRYPLRLVSRIKLTNPRLVSLAPDGRTLASDDKGFMVATVCAPGREIRLLCGHLLPLKIFGKDILDPEFDELRDQISGIITGYREDYLAVCADMNLGSLEKAFPSIYKSELSEAFKDIPTIQKGLWMDHILLGKGILRKSACVIAEKCSHYLCYAEVSYNEKSPTRSLSPA